MRLVKGVAAALVARPVKHLLLVDLKLLVRSTNFRLFTLVRVYINVSTEDALNLMFT